MPDSTYQDSYPALLADAVRQGRSLQQFADDIGIKFRTVRRWLEIKPELRAAWATRDTAMFRPEYPARFEDACKRGLSIVQFAKEIGHNLRTVRGWVDERPEMAAIWAAHQRTGRQSTFKPEYCDKLEDAMRRGLTMQQFAREIGVEYGCLRAWITRREDFRDARRRGIEAGFRHAQNKGVGISPRWQEDPSVAEAFWEQVDKNGPGGCWLWTGTKLPKPWDYGNVGIRGRSWRAHRVALELTGTEVPADAHACHHCDVPSCVNPAHLYVGTPKENTADIIRRGRWDRRPGEKHPNAKLTDEIVLEIRAMRRKGASQKEISDRFGGLGSGLLSDICNRKLWRHI